MRSCQKAGQLLLGVFLLGLAHGMLCGALLLSMPPIHRRTPACTWLLLPGPPGACLLKFMPSKAWLLLPGLGLLAAAVYQALLAASCHTSTHLCTSFCSSCSMRA